MHNFTTNVLTQLTPDQLIQFQFELFLFSQHIAANVAFFCTLIQRVF